MKRPRLASMSRAHPSPAFRPSCAGTSPPLGEKGYRRVRAGQQAPAPRLRQPSGISGSLARRKSVKASGKAGDMEAPEGLTAGRFLKALSGACRTCPAVRTKPSLFGKLPSGRPLPHA